MDKIDKTKKNWTLNADVGEGCDDTLVMPYIDCANISCGAHAGDENIIRETLKLAKQQDVIVGAHPGYPDKANFGRYSLEMTMVELTETLTTQIRLLFDLANKQGLSTIYVKPHGALNHDMLQKSDILEVICRVVAAIDKNMVLVMPTNAKQAEQQKLAHQYGVSIWWEVFADRAYEPSGLLRPRKFDDAVHAEPQTIVEQLQCIRESAEIVAIDGSVLDVSIAQTICIHGDNASSITAVKLWANQA